MPITFQGAARRGSLAPPLAPCCTRTCSSPLSHLQTSNLSPTATGVHGLGSSRKVWYALRTQAAAGHGMVAV